MKNVTWIKSLRQENILNILIPLIIFYISPIISLFIAFYILTKKNQELPLINFAILTSLYIALINITKSTALDADLQWYSDQYLEAGQLSYLDYIFSFGINGKGKELFFPTFNYIVYFFIGDDVILYRAVHSFTCYTLLFYAIYRFAKYLRIKFSYVGIIIIVLSHFPWIFTYSATILRQFLAASILIWIIVERFCYNKKMIIPVICMFLSHTSSLLFVPLLYLPFFKKEISKSTCIYYILGLLFLILIQPITELLYNIVGNSIPALTYTLERASKDTTFELPPLGISKILFLLGEVIIPLLLYYRRKIRPHNIMGIINIVIILNIFILINLSQLELSNRLFLYSTFLLSIILCYLFTKIRLGNSVLWSIFLIFEILLTIYYNTSIHAYNIKFGIIFLPQLFI